MIFWSFAIIAILGTLCVSVLKRVYLGHWLWLISNVGLVACNAYLEIWPMVFLFVIYGVISGIGIFRWRTDDR